MSIVFRCVCVGGVTQREGTPGVASVDWLLRSRDRGQRALSQEQVDGAVKDTDQLLLFFYYAVGQK